MKDMPVDVNGTAHTFSGFPSPHLTLSGTQCIWTVAASKLAALQLPGIAFSYAYWVVQVTCCYD